MACPVSFGWLQRRRARTRSFSRTKSCCNCSTSQEVSLDNMATRPLKLISYYTTFKYARMIGAAIAAAVPFVPKILGDTWTEYLLAPLGSLDIVARVSLIVLCAATTYLVYFLQGQSQSRRKTLLSLTLVAIPFLFLCLYILAAYFFVREIYIPTL